MDQANYHFEKLTREMIVSQLMDDPHAPARAAEISCETIVAGIKGIKAAHTSQEAQESVRQICHGMLNGILLINKSLPDAAVALLQNLADAANKLNLDPSQMMTWSMEGMARITPMVAPQTLQNITSAINAKFMGAGDVFDHLARQARPKT